MLLTLEKSRAQCQQYNTKKTIRSLTMYQFLHISSYSRSASKRKKDGHSVRSIVAEAVREHGSTPRIENPKPPIYIYGQPLELLEARCVAWGDSVRDASGKKTRKDALCLMAGVVSAPREMAPAEWEKLRSDAVGWLQKKYGERLHAVVEHIDEKHPHVHFFVVPNLGERFDQVHDGKRAAAEMKHELKGLRNTAYCEAMRGVQDDFFKEVGMPNGMLRLGPRRRRLSTAEWQQEKAQAKALHTALLASEEVRTATLQEAGKIISHAKGKAAQIEAGAVAKGEHLGRVEFAKKSFFGKVMDMSTGLVRDNVALRSQLSEATQAASGWKAKAAEYHKGFKRFFGIAKEMKPKFESMEIEVNVLAGQVSRLKKDLEQEKVNSSRLANDLSATKYKLGSKQALLDMHEERERDSKRPAFSANMPMEVNWQESAKKTDDELAY